MMKCIIICFLFLFPFVNSFSQDKKDFSIEFNINQIVHDMEYGNQYIQTNKNYDYAGFSTEKEYLNTLGRGLDYYAGVNYQPLNFMDFGVYGNYQVSKLERTFFYYAYWKGKMRTETNAFSYGLSANLYLNKLLHFETSNSGFFQKLILSVGVKGGLGFSRITEKSAIENYSALFTNAQFHADNFNGRAELSVGYPLFNQSFFSSIGFKIGYQYFKTSSLKNYADEYLYTANGSGKPMSIDFSGLYYGIYLKIGKH